MASSSINRASKDLYQVCVTIIEARYLAQNANPTVVVKIGNQKKRTIVREKTDNPYYNEYFVFSFTCGFDEFLSKSVTIAVYLQTFLRRLKLYSSTDFEVATVWDQPNHQFLHKWAMLTNPKDISGRCKGFVKCDITAITRGLKPNVYPDTDGEEDIEGNLLLPVRGIKVRHKARFLFAIYWAEDLPKLDLKRCCHAETRKVYVQISFSGMKGITNKQRVASKMKFLERIIFKEMFPPLCCRVRIAIKAATSGCKGRIVSNHILNLSKTFSSENERGKNQLGEDPFLSLKRPFSIGDVKSEEKTEPLGESAPSSKSKRASLGATKPCVNIRFFWPNVEWRILNSNSLLKLADFLETELEKLDDLIAVEHRQAYERYNEMVGTLSRHLSDYLEKMDTKIMEENGGTTKLDRYRMTLCREEIESIIKIVEINGPLPNNNYIRIATIHAYKYLHKIRQLCQDPQHGFPDVYVWMVTGSKRVAYASITAADIFYGEEACGRGIKCGQRVNISLTDPKDGRTVYGYDSYDIDLLLWLGNAKYLNACWSMIPAGFDNAVQTDQFPQAFTYTESHKFQLRAHVFQGRFDPGMDSSGLMDPLTRVKFHGHSMSTQVIGQSLDPFWDQTLIFPVVDIFGTRSGIKRLPPKVIIEIFDQDFCVSFPPAHFRTFSMRFLWNDSCQERRTPSTGDDGTVWNEFRGTDSQRFIRTYSVPKLQWYKFASGDDRLGDANGAILAAFELIEMGEEDARVESVRVKPAKKLYSIPKDIKPKMTTHRLEIIFWGVRDMKRVHLLPVLKPKIIIETGGVHVNSEIMESAKKFCNFQKTHVVIDLEMPDNDIYYPPVSIKAYDSRGFGCSKYLGVCFIPTVHVFLHRLITEEEYNSQLFNSTGNRAAELWYSSNVILPLPRDYNPDVEESKGLISYKLRNPAKPHLIKKTLSFVTNSKVFEMLTRCCRKKEEIIYGDDDDGTHDWWSKYFASLQVIRQITSNTPVDRETTIYLAFFSEEKDIMAGIRSPRYRRKSVATFKIYTSELETQPEFAGFQDRIRTFELVKGKLDNESRVYKKNVVGIFKGYIALYRWPHPGNVPCKTKRGRDATYGICDDYPSQESIKVLVRVYVIKGVNLHPSDPLTGKSDPYLRVVLGKTCVNDKKNYIPNELNPTFGKLFEIKATFPRDHTLTIQIWDYDATSPDDLIGETKIDIENRFYSRHRANCGLAKTYASTGYNVWRDKESPSQILQFLCMKNNLPVPEYHEDVVKIGKKSFPFNAVLEHPTEADIENCMALNVLHQWDKFPICGHALVPEHVERRSLFNPERPGLEQGKLELWVEIFQENELPMKPPIDITPHTPEDYELRIIIWNTEDIPLVDSQFLTGEKCSDIYVKGWIVHDDIQKTDVHYNSLTGEGNFNWRFIFRFSYLSSERMMVIKKKLSTFAKNETEQKVPCKLNLQVWDSDHLSPDDFLGALSIDLSRMPKGSANPKNCTLKVMDPESTTINLFKTMRMKTWLPFTYRTEAGEYVQAGKIELELILMLIDEADKDPVGLGRQPPEPLPPPNRPDTSYSWLRNPWKAFRFVVCRYYKWKIICCITGVLGALLVACAVYAFPGYFVKRLLGA
ncbi:LOW QUALITY PROTEIN: otoferlin [Orussus abietinus]|uniref:LOW QUALITY PROTEIN: otoferlin n=1 Tax=Orussus abietinus TaxID=222816 RepID=UPI000C715F0E|nr:LOW QUALITY PROTEIN: otoferlin [Orussus abietinus]